MKIRNKIISMVLSVFCTSYYADATSLIIKPIIDVSADDNLQINAIEWSFGNSGTLTIIGTGDMESYSAYDDIPWYSFKDQIKSIVISDGITSIGAKAFSQCSNITSIDIPESVNKIESIAFSGCKSLTSIEIPESVAYIGYSAFYGCSGLESITLPDSIISIEEGLFYNCKSLSSVHLPSELKTIGRSAFYGCSSLNSIEIPNTVSSIDQYAFYGCSSLSAVNIPQDIEVIDEYTFYGCKNLSDIVIPFNVTEILKYAFYGCDGLTTITIPARVSTIGSYAFCNCASLKSIEIQNSNCEIYDSVTTISNNYSDSYYTRTQYSGDILGYDGSSAQEYAKKYGCGFREIEKNTIYLRGQKNTIEIDALNGEYTLNYDYIKQSAIYIANTKESNRYPDFGVLKPISVEFVNASFYKNDTSIIEVSKDGTLRPKSIGTSPLECHLEFRIGYYVIPIRYEYTETYDYYSDYTINVSNKANITTTTTTQAKTTTTTTQAKATTTTTQVKTTTIKTQAETTTTTMTQIIYGDANCSGATEISDAVAILHFVALPTKYPLTEAGQLNADIVDRGTSGVNGKDALAIQMIIRRLIEPSELPVTSQVLIERRK